MYPSARHIFNFLVTIVKQYIYKTKCFGGRLDFNALQEEIKQIYYIERNIANHKNKWKKHVDKWSSIKDIAYRDDNFVEQYLQEL